MAREILLRIDEIAPERDYIQIFGIEYELAILNKDFGLEQRLRLQQYQPTWDRLMRLDSTASGGGASEADLVDLRVLLREFIPLVIPQAPDDVIDRLSESQKLDILVTFCEASGLPVPNETPTPTPSRKTGARSSRGSRTDTESRQKHG